MRAEDGAGAGGYDRNLGEGYRADADAHVLHFESVCSNYAPDELAPGASDPYADKAFHRAFLEVMSWK